MRQCHKNADTLNKTAMVDKQFNFIPLWLFDKVFIAKVRPIINVINITNAFNLNYLADGQISGPNFLIAAKFVTVLFRATGFQVPS